MRRDEAAAGEGLGGPAMEAAQRDWMRVFYNDPPWREAGKTYLTRFANVVSAQTATLAAGELVLRAGNGPRARYLEEQLARFMTGGLRNSIQLAAAGGWAVLKPNVHGKSIFCDVVAAGDFVPLRLRGGVLEAAVFADSAVANGKRYVRLETHDLQPEGVRITNRAYVAGAAARGREVPLGVVPDWTGLQEEVLVEGAVRPLYAVLKMPFANCVEPGNPLPVSLYACAMDSLREIDRIYSEFLWEVKSGRRKQILDVTAAQPLPGRGGTTRWEGGDQYLVLDMGGNVDKPYDDYSPEMRVEAYRAALNIQLRLLESQCQLSPGTFDFDPKTGRAMTATQVASDDRVTFNTIKAIQENGLRQGLLDLVAVYDIFASLYDLAPYGEIEPGVEFGDGLFEDTGVEFDRRMRLAQAGYIKPEELTGWYFGVSEETAEGMVEKTSAR